jgi:hypothetical protein
MLAAVRFNHRNGSGQGGGVVAACIGESMLSRHSRDDNNFVQMATMDTIALSHKRLMWLTTVTTWSPWLPRTQP